MGIRLITMRQFEETEQMKGVSFHCGPFALSIRSFKRNEIGMPHSCNLSDVFISNRLRRVFPTAHFALLSDFSRTRPFRQYG